MRGYRLDPHADVELAYAAATLEAERQGAARDFLDDYWETLTLARTTPGFGTKVDVGEPVVVRWYLLDTFSYRIFALVEEDDLIVIAIAHHHREEGYWRDRLASKRTK